MPAGVDDKEDEEYEDQDEDFEAPLEDKVLDSDRGYTDVPWLLLALAVVAGTVILAVQGALHQRMHVVSHGMDWRGRTCGVDDLEDAPLHGWVNPMFETIEAGSVCLRSCPVTSNGGQVSTWGTIMCVCNPAIDADVNNPLTPLGSMCSTADAQQYGYVFNNNYASQSDISSYVTYTDSTTMRPCTFQFVTHQIMKMCLPALDPVNYDQIVAQSCGASGSDPCGLEENLSKHLNTSRFLVARVMADVAHCGMVIILCCGCAIVFAMALFFLIQHEVGTRVMLWSNILWLVCLSWACAHSSGYFRDRSGLEPILASQSSDEFSAHLLSTVSWVCGFAAVFMLFYTIYFSLSSFKVSKVEVPGVNVVHKTDDDAPTQPAVATASRTLVLAGSAIEAMHKALDDKQVRHRPLYWSVTFQVVCTLVLLGGWYAMAFALMSAADVWTDEHNVSHLTFKLDLQWSLIYHLLAFIWVMEVMDIVVIIVAGGAVALFIFAPTVDAAPGSGKRYFPIMPLWHSFSTVGKFHLGTMIAAASVAMVARPLRVVTDVIHWLRFGTGVPNSRWDTTRPDPGTCCGCIEILYHKYILQLIRGTDKRAVVQTVLHGTPFFAATRATWHLNKHYGKYMAVPLYSSAVAMFITRNNIALSCCLIGHLLIMTESFDVQINTLQSTAMPLIVIFFFGHVIGWAFLSHLDAIVVTEMVGYAEAKLRLYTPGVPQLTVPYDLLILCEDSQVKEVEEPPQRDENIALVGQRG